MRLSSSKDEVRSAVDGAGRAFQVIDGGRGGGGVQAPPPSSGDEAPCPVAPLGHSDGTFFFLDVRGQRRALSARQLGSRNDMLSLFLGDDAWLRTRFPHRKPVKVNGENGEEKTEEKVVDFRLNAASAYMQKRCGDAGLFGKHITFRAPGIWKGSAGLPIVHCGDKIMVDGAWIDAGVRIDDEVYAAASRERRPETACSAKEAQDLQISLRDLWNWRIVGGEIVALGLVGVAYYGAAAAWRPNGFLIGASGSGKSELLTVLAALCPLRFETNDTRKAALEQGMSNRAMPCFIDEASDRVDQQAARNLIDVVLGASGGEGTRGTRGTIDGKGREFVLAGSFIYASIAPPELEAQHLGRITIIELERPGVGADNKAQHSLLRERARDLAPKLWGRALEGFSRYQRAVDAFREELQKRGCLAREMDQFGALLAAWWVLTQEGDPGSRGTLEGVAAIAGYLRTAEQVMHEDTPRLVIQHLVSSRISLHRSTDRDQIGTLIEIALKPRSAMYTTGDMDQARDPDAATRLLASYGIRVVRATDTTDARGRSAPRAADGAGIWIAVNAGALVEIFRDTRWAGTRWLIELKRIESAVDRTPIRIGAYVGRATWISMSDIYPEGVRDDGSAAPEPFG